MLTISLDGEVLYEQPLMVKGDVEQAGFLARIWDSIKLFFTGLFGG